jgi:prepilin-type N-terminal cleavage/methylation domain-containing protein/prepilin-type processing-associated H-X9-DG protein
MLRRGKGFTLIELLVVVAIIGALIAILVPSLAKVRKRTRTVVCQTNLRGLTQLYRMTVQQTGAAVITNGGHMGGGAWDYQLVGTQTPGVSESAYYSNTRKPGPLDKFRYCPETDPSRRSVRSTGSSFQTWECLFPGNPGSNGSYEINGWVLPIRTSGPGAPSADDLGKYYDLKRLNNESTTPVFADGVWHDFRPYWDDPAPVSVIAPSAANDGFDRRGIRDIVVNRHDKKTNIAFWDGRVEAYKLEDVKQAYWNKKWTPTSFTNLNYTSY